MRLRKRHFGIFILLMTISLTCRFSAVDYATGDVQLRSKTKVTVGGKPAIDLEIENTGEEAVRNIDVTIKAKRNQNDLQSVTVFIDHLDANEAVNELAVFDLLRTHEDYDLLTFAVRFSQ